MAIDIWRNWKDPEEEKPSIKKGFGVTPSPPSTSKGLWRAWQEPEPEQEPMTFGEGFKRGAEMAFSTIPGATVRGAAEGVTTELPKLAGEAAQFVGSKTGLVGMEKAGKSVADWAEKTGKKLYGEEPKYTGLSKVAYEGTKMLGPSVIPGGGVATGARALLSVGKLAKAAKLAQTAGRSAEAAKLLSRADQLAKVSLKLGSGSAAGLFGLAQAQQTTETGERRISELETAGNYAEADRVRKSLKYAPYINGAIEAFGEYFGTKYLGKALGLNETTAVKKGAWNVAKDFLKTLGVEVGTEIAQSGGEAGVEKVTGIRPEADPIREALDVIGPTAFMTILTGGMGAGVRRLRRDKAEPAPTEEDNVTNKFLENIETRLNNPEDTVIVPSVIEGMMGDPRFEKVKPQLQDILDKHLEGKGQAVKAPEEEPGGAGLAETEGVADIEPVERRQEGNRELRKKVADMTLEEREQALLTDPLTGQRNKRAYDESDIRQPVQTSIDVDGLKYVNDTFGHEAGNELLRKVGGVFNRVTPEGVSSYHFHGDEFAMEGQTPEQIEEAVAAARQILAAEPLTFTDESGKEVKYVADFSHGVAETMEQADQAMLANKVQRRVQRGAAPVNPVEQALETDTHGQKIDELMDSPELAEEKAALEPGTPIQQAPIQETPVAAPDQDYESQAAELGVTFNGMQEQLPGEPDLPMFTDPEMGGTFIKREDETLEEARQRQRERFKGKEVIPNAEEDKGREAEIKGQTETQEGKITPPTVEAAPLPSPAEAVAEPPALTSAPAVPVAPPKKAKPAKVIPLKPKPKTTLVKKPTKMVLKSRESVVKAISVVEEIAPKEMKRESQQRRKAMDRAWESVRVHAGKLGIEVPQRSTFYNPEQDLENIKVVKAALSEPLAPEQKAPEATAPLDLTGEINKAISDKPSGMLESYEKSLAESNGVPVIVPKGKRLALENALFNEITAKTGGLGGAVTQVGEDKIGEAVFKVARPYGSLAYDEATGQLSFERSELTAKMAVKETKLGVDKTLLLQTISKDIVNNDLAATIANETLQNALDSYAKNQEIKSLYIDVDRVRTEDGTAAIRVIVEDNGTGMTEAEVTKNLLRLGAKGKAGTTTRGGYGLAKAAFLLTPIRAKVVTVKNGVKTTLEGTREQFFGVKAAGNPTVTTTTNDTDQSHGTRFELTFFKNEKDAKAQNAFHLSRWHIEQEFRNYLGKGILTPGIDIIFSIYGRAVFREKTASLKSEPKIFPTKKLNINGNTVTINFVEDPNPPYKNWSKKYTPNIDTFNKGFALFSIRNSAYGVSDLSDQPQWKVVVDFEKTVDVRGIDYPFIRNRTELNRAVRDQISQVINERIVALNEKTFTGKKADFDKMVNSSPTVNGIRVLIPFKDKAEFKKAEKLIRSNEQVVSDLADIFVSFQRILDKVGGKKLDLAMTVDPGVHGFRSKPEVTGYEFYAINPFAITDSLLHHALFAEITGKGFDELTAMSSNLVHTLIHEYTHSQVMGHGEDFSSAMAQNYMLISHALLTRLEFQARRFYEKHKDALASLQNDFGSMGKGGSQFSKDSLAVSATGELTDRSTVGKRYARSRTRREELGPIASPVPKDIKETLDSLYEDAFGGGGIENPPSGRARDVIGKNVETFMYWLVDKNRPIELVQAKLRSMSEGIDLFLQETQRPKVTAAKIKDAWETDVVPFLKKISTTLVSLPELEEYALAVHVPEANRTLRQANAKRFLNNILNVIPEDDKTLKEFKALLRKEEVRTPQEYFDWLHSAFILFGEDEKVAEIEKKWDKFKEKPAGMTDGEAARIVQAYAGDKNIEELRLMLLAINNRRLDILRDAGLLADEEYKVYKKKYKNYVPLQREGFEEVPAGSGRGVQAAGRPVKTRMGSSRNVVSIVANSIFNYETAIARAEKAESAKIFLNLVKANPDPDLWSINKVKKAPAYDDYGNIRLYPNIGDVAKDEIRIMVNGEQYLISVAKDNTDLMRMLRVLKAQDVGHGAFLNAFAKINKWMARVNTSWSVEFIATNFVRDLQAANINIKSTDVTPKKMVRGAIKSAKAIFRVEREKRNNDELEKYYDRYKDAGGKISWSDVHKSAEDLTKKLNQEIATLSGGRPVMATAESWLKFFEDANTAIENGVRLHVFIIAVKQGMSDKKAANLASDLTVDFTKSGAAGPALNALFLFANAGIQGSYRLIRGMAKSKTIRYKIIPSIIGAGFLVGLYNSLLGGADDDGEDYFNKIDDFMKERNAIFMIPGTKGRSVKFPLPWGYNFFWGVGTEIARTFTQKNYKYTEGGLRLASTFANAFNPLAAGTFLQTILPTAFDPIAMVGENKNWFGGELMPPQNIFAKVKTPDSQRFWKSTSTLSKWTASLLNTLAGGSEVRSGRFGLDISPATLDLLVDMAGGSMLKFFTDTFTIPKRLITGEEIALQNIPFIRRFSGQKSEWADSRLYTTNVTEVLTAAEELKRYKGTDKYEGLAEQLRPFNSLVPRAYAAEYRLKTLRKSRTRAETVKDKDLVKKRSEEINEVYWRFNKYFNEAMEKK